MVALVSFRLRIWVRLPAWWPCMLSWSIWLLRFSAWRAERMVLWVLLTGPCWLREVCCLDRVQFLEGTRTSGAWEERVH